MHQGSLWAVLAGRRFLREDVIAAPANVRFVPIAAVQAHHGEVGSLQAQHDEIGP